MPAIARAGIIAGPAKITYKSQTFWSKGDIAFDIVPDRFDVNTSTHGKVDDKKAGHRVVLSFEPAGRFNAALAAVLWPYGATAIGASIFTASDVPLVINSIDGRKITVHAAAVTAMPQMRLGAVQTIGGQITFTGVVKNNTDPSDANAYVTEASESYPADTGFDVEDILTTPYLATWGGDAPWENFLTEGGWTIDFALTFADQRVDGIGVVDMTLSNLEVTASCVPVGPTAAQIIAAAMPATPIGSSMGTGDDLVITSEFVGAPVVTISKAGMIETGLAFGSTAKRVKATKWVATRVIGTPLFAVGVVAAP